LVFERGKGESLKVKAERRKVVIFDIFFENERPCFLLLQPRYLIGFSLRRLVLFNQSKKRKAKSKKLLEPAFSFELSA
jgi:hypothetical protein